MSDTEVGKVLRDPQERDAIHIAVACVLANERLYPGQRISLVEGSTQWVRAESEASRVLGIVDPYLEHPVHRSDRFWMFLLPRTITGLKHVWSHPAFPGWETPPATSESELEVMNRQVKTSEEWLRNFIGNADLPGYDAVLEAVKYYDGEDDLRLSDDGCGEIPNEFWNHMEVVTGQKFPRRATYFSCSC